MENEDALDIEFEHDYIEYTIFDELDETGVIKAVCNNDFY